ncbi:DUF1992 domain-containing protein [Leptolinea tardivitalis]|uniref:DnaJ family domain-containing protein n=1 Tax=Leptolinea tardivitalis TaxID=229920 RepID=UPI000783B5A6|nr:DUF1992 domain-containing protein [Leptolinea tardivitalis]GAP21684.1 hypothetical protein LTAR_01898 [Leptolinea tardivitalis]
MDALHIIAENKIKEAQSDGVFDHLEGSGKPVNIETIHPAGDDHYMANHILKANHFLPVWLEDRKQLQLEIMRAQQQLKNTVILSPEIRDSIEQLNRRISGYNLRVPVESLRLMPVPIPGE